MVSEHIRQQLVPCDGTRPRGQYVALPRHVMTWGLSLPAAVAYAFLLDRTSLSAKNGWRDQAGRPYIRYSQSALARDLGMCQRTARTVLGELEANGLLRQEGSPGKSSRLYLYVLPEEPEDPAEPPAQSHSHEDRTLRQSAEAKREKLVARIRKERAEKEALRSDPESAGPEVPGPGAAKPPAGLAPLRFPADLGHLEALFRENGALTEGVDP